MASKYVMKVSELTELATAQCNALCEISNQAEARCKTAYELHIADVAREALGRLDVLDDLKHIDQLEHELKVVRQRVSEGIAANDSGRHFFYFSQSLEAALQGCMRYGSAMPPNLAEEVQQIMHERGVPMALGYRAPSTQQLVREFKECKTLQEVKDVMRKHHDHALEHFAPVLNATTPTTPEGIHV